jgi:hypothetical protein
MVVCPFVLFLLATLLSVLLQFMASDYPFGIFKLFLVTSILSYKPHVHFRLDIHILVINDDRIGL